MACKILRNNTNISHGPEHDLESLFYVFMWICTTQAGPSSLSRKDLCDAETPLLKWNDPSLEFTHVADFKLAKCGIAHVFESDILKHYHNYFEDLKGCSRQLRELFFPPNGRETKPTHEDVLNIFHQTLEALSKGVPKVTPSDDTYHSAPHEGEEILTLDVEGWDRGDEWGTAPKVGIKVLNDSQKCSKMNVEDEDNEGYSGDDNNNDDYDDNGNEAIGTLKCKRGDVFNDVIQEGSQGEPRRRYTNIRLGSKKAISLGP
jgi:hypothetical protein